MRQFAAGFVSCLLLILAVGLVAKLYAQDWVIGSGIPIHLDGEKHCNDRVTPGFGVEVHGYAIGVYDNSNCKTSFYAAKFWTPLKYGALKLGTLGGLATGYTAPVLPVGGFVAAVEGAVYKLNIIFIPPVGSSGNVLWFQIGKRW